MLRISELCTITVNIVLYTIPNPPNRHNSVGFLIDEYLVQQRHLVDTSLAASLPEESGYIEMLKTLIL